MKKMSDPILAGGIAGAIGSAVKEATARFLFVKTGIAPFDGIEKGAGMIIDAYEVRTPKGTMVGILMDMSLGAGLGALMAVLHRKRVFQINPLNGLLIGLGSWTTMYGALGGISSFRRTTPNGALSTAVWHLIYGVITGGLISVLVEQEPEQEVSVEETTKLQPGTTVAIKPVPMKVIAQHRHGFKGQTTASTAPPDHPPLQ